MFEHAQRTLPDLRALEVTLDYDPDDPREPTVVLNMYRTAGPGHDAVPRQWRAWMARTFPPQVCQHFALVTVYE
jgi:hypothetical protein